MSQLHRHKYADADILANVAVSPRWRKPAARVGRRDCNKRVWLSRYMESSPVRPQGNFFFHYPHSEQKFLFILICLKCCVWLERKLLYIPLSIFYASFSSPSSTYLEGKGMNISVSFLFSLILGGRTLLVYFLLLLLPYSQETFCYFSVFAELIEETFLQSSAVSLYTLYFLFCRFVFPLISRWPPFPPPTPQSY